MAESTMDETEVRTDVMPGACHSAEVSQVEKSETKSVMEEIEAKLATNDEEDVECFADSILKEFKRLNWCWPFPYTCLKDTLMTLAVSVSPSLWDVGSDWALGAVYLTKGDYTWGTLTLLATLLPGLEWWAFREQVIGRAGTRSYRRWRGLYVVSSLFFPLFLVFYKVVDHFIIT